jgi:hypothetical protein
MLVQFSVVCEKHLETVSIWWVAAHFLVDLGFWDGPYLAFELIALWNGNGDKNNNQTQHIRMV